MSRRTRAETLRVDADELRDALMIPDSAFALRVELGLRLRSIKWAWLADLARLFKVGPELADRTAAEADRLADLADMISEARAAER